MAATATLVSLKVYPTPTDVHLNKYSNCGIQVNELAKLSNFNKELQQQVPQTPVTQPELAKQTEVKVLIP